MALGFVLIKVSPKREKEVYETLSSIPEVEELYPLFGEYDLITKLVVTDFEQLSDVIVSKVRSIEGVIETKTLTGAKF
ncbi:MAG: Lrp/AsnC ligand binding domain-containing protein [Archaeoglobaceae archaeon]